MHKQRCIGKVLKETWQRSFLLLERAKTYRKSFFYLFFRYDILGWYVCLRAGWRCWLRNCYRYFLLHSIFLFVICEKRFETFEICNMHTNTHPAHENTNWQWHQPYDARTANNIRCCLAHGWWLCRIILNYLRLNCTRSSIAWEKNGILHLWDAECVLCVHCTAHTHSSHKGAYYIIINWICVAQQQIRRQTGK